jgi:hypothetical protein
MLTELSTIKNRLGITDTVDDTLLTNLIKFASGRFDRECNRSFARASGVTEEFGGDEAELRLGRYPIESVTSLHLKTTESDGWVEQTGIAYLLRDACIISLSGALGTRQQQLRVTYAGGYVLPGATPGSGQTALPDEIEQACIEQVALWYQRRHHLGLASVPTAERTFYKLAEVDLLPQVAAILRQYTRLLA